MKEKIRNILEGALPLVADNFGIDVDATDATPANFKSLDTLAEMVRRKQNADA